MSEKADCPYCGNEVLIDRVVDYDSKIKLRCRNCNGVFEYMPGFGAFTLPEQERTGPIRQEGSMPRYHYEADSSWDTQEPPTPQGGCCGCCGAFFCFCILLVILSIFLGFSLFWWLW
ncbi:MAG: hypothetical protein ACFFE2_12805 [Candidatus Thorarchaeota archaeon]